MRQRGPYSCQVIRSFASPSLGQPRYSIQTHLKENISRSEESCATLKTYCPGPGRELVYQRNLLYVLEILNRNLLRIETAGLVQVEQCSLQTRVYLRTDVLSSPREVVEGYGCHTVALA